jgi:zinc-binding alcohol dehydrogenase family protein
MMKAIAYQQDRVLQDIELPIPEPGPHDLLVEIKAVAINPVDNKIYQRITPEANEWQILGWDAAGIVRQVGDRVTLFKPGDDVFYAGAIDRPGCFSDYHLVDERIVGRKPDTLSFEQAAALPLTSITAWELLFDRLSVASDSTGSLLILAAAGGVGSMLTQLAHHLTELVVIASASRNESNQWIKNLGADHVIDHQQNLLPQLNHLGFDAIDQVASLSHTDQHFSELVDCLAPQGKLALIDDPDAIDVKLLKRKSLSLHWEFMYTRPLFKTHDMIEQHHLLNQIAKLMDAGILKSTFRHHAGNLNAKNLEQALFDLNHGHNTGKTVLTVTDL